MAKRISSSEPKPKRTAARRRTDKPAASAVPPIAEAAEVAAPAPDVAVSAPAVAPVEVRPAGGTLADKVSRVASSPAIWGREEPKPDTRAVARRAFELFLARGGVHGHDVEDWLAAERELRRR
jgi:hypothetical protein